MRTLLSEFGKLKEDYIKSEIIAVIKKSQNKQLLDPLKKLLKDPIL